MSNWIQEITGIDDGRGRARRTLARIRRELINIHGGDDIWVVETLYSLEVFRRRRGVLARMRR